VDSQLHVALDEYSERLNQYQHVANFHRYHQLRQQEMYASKKELGVDLIKRQKQIN
tara:strand:+ start:410 stop:577 length:168 start_codon:yes stop_codon:yes gene_type:complete